MDIDVDIGKRLALWQQGRASAPGPHLPSSLLYQMAEDGGLAAAPADDKEHLSLCPDCLAVWADWRRAISLAAEAAVAPEDSCGISYVLLEAAASAGARAPVRMQSACGHFALSLLPSQTDPSRGLLALEILRLNAIPDSSYVTVRDRTGRVLLQGHLEDGRIARTIANLSEFDLSTCTITLDEGASA